MDIPFEVLKYVVLLLAILLGGTIIIFVGPEGVMKFLENISSLFIRPLAMR